MAASFKVVIPARHGAVRLPGKPLRLLAGAPMIAHVIRRACASGAEQVIVATDDERIAAVAYREGVEAELTPPELASGTDRVACVALRRGWPEDALVVNLQGDEPLMAPLLVNQAAQDLAEQGDADAATLAAPLTEAALLFAPHTVKVVCDHAGYALYFSRAPIPWDRDAYAAAPGVLPAHGAYRLHIGLYAYRVAALRRYTTLAPTALEEIERLEQLRLLYYGLRMHVALAVTQPGFGIDTEADLARAESLLAHSHYSEVSY